jgi:hypothetical protein
VNVKAFLRSLHSQVAPSSIDFSFHDFTELLLVLIGSKGVGDVTDRDLVDHTRFFALRRFFARPRTRLRT